MAKTLVSDFSPPEREMLERGIPDLAQWGEKLLVPFVVHRLLNANVIWSNRRWFLERGFDLTLESQRHRVFEWLIAEFAWATKCVGVGKETKLGYADRYGTTDGMAQHGGSGRVATLGRFQAKGVGQTPLVSHGVAPGHSHGCISIAEALREAIFAEIACEEFPCGAIPVIAVIDTGLYFSSPNPDDRYDQNARRAILVRPATIRPAHAERAPLFKRSVTGFINRQSDDVRRTSDVVAHWVSHRMDNTDTKMQSESEVLAAFVRAIVEQIAFGQVHRLFSGGYFSSNVSIYGELLDFGNTHALPNWASTQVHSVVAGLGDEIRLFKRVIASLAFYFTKYQRRGNALALSQELQALCDSHYNEAWQRYSLQLFQANDMGSHERDALHTILRDYFRYQQKFHIKYRFGEAAAKSAYRVSNWLYRILLNYSTENHVEDYQTLHAVDSIFRTQNETVRYVGWWTASRLLKPRESVDRKHLLQSLDQLVPKLGERRAIDVNEIDDFVRKSVSGARRYWQHLPTGYAVHAHICHDGYSALICSNGPGSARFAWIEGRIGPNGALHLFDRQFVYEDLKTDTVKQFGARWSATYPLSTTPDGAHVVHMQTGDVILPKMEVHYELPHSFIS